MKQRHPVTTSERTHTNSLAHLVFTLLMIPALLYAPLPAYAQDQIAIIPDGVLKQSLWLALSKPFGSDITVAELAALQELTLEGYVTHDDDSEHYRIRDLTGLEHAVELRSLIISRSEEVTNLAPIRGLTKLTVLRVPSNGISDIEPVAGLTNLTVLAADDNGLGRNIAPVAGLSKLTELSLEGNKLVDVNPVRGLTNLTILDLDQNFIQDVSPLTNLTRLVELDLDRNVISDLSPLSVLTNLEELDLDGNSITNLSPLTSLRVLRDLDLLRNDVADVAPLSGLITLTNLVLARNQLTNITALAGLTNLASLNLRGNVIDVSSGSSNQSTLDTLEAGGTVVQLAPQFIDDPAHLIPDSRLRALVQYWGNIPYETNLTAGHLSQVTTINPGGPDFLDATLIHDLTGLQYLTNLSTFYLYGSRISDLGPLAGLTRMSDLAVEYSEVTDLKPLSGLKSLNYLNLGNNRISSLVPLSGLTTLGSLGLGKNEIVDLSPLSTLRELFSLDISENKIVDLSALAGLTSLIYLSLNSNRIIDLTPLQGLPLQTGGIGLQGMLRVENNFLNLATGSPARVFLDRVRSLNYLVSDLPQRQFELTILRQPAGVQLSWPGFRGLRYEVQSTTTLTNWPPAAPQTFSGMDAELSFERPASGGSSFFRLLVSEEP